MALSEQVSILTSVITAAATLFLVIYAYQQIRAMRKSRDATTLLAIFKIMNEVREKRIKLFKLPENYEEWDDTHKKLAYEVSITLEDVASLPEMGLIEPRYLLEMYHGVFDKAWRILEPYIEWHRKDTGEPSQRIHFQKFAQKCREFGDKWTTNPYVKICKNCGKEIPLASEKCKKCGAGQT